jgi:hypothetical protein
MEWDESGASKLMKSSGLKVIKPSPAAAQQINAVLKDQLVKCVGHFLRQFIVFQE